MRFTNNLLIFIVLTALTAGCDATNNGLLGSLGGAFQGRELSEGTVVAGLKEALRVGTDRAVSTLSKEGGYAENTALRIGMPEQLAKLANTLRQIGLGQQVDLFEQKMNEAAESAASKAAPVFLNAIGQMSFADARQVLGGDQTAITDYFREKTLTRLTELYTPVVREHMNQVGAVKQYNTIVGRYRSVPLVPKIDFSPDSYVTEQALKGLFVSLAEVERDIRTNPAARTTDLLRQVFDR
jgi:hypothetical protein